MKKSYLLLLLALLVVASCKKKTDDTPEPEDQPTINIPSGEFWVNLVYDGNGQQNVTWTKDFQTYYLYNTSLKAPTITYRSGNILLVAHSSSQNYSLSYGDVFNPSEFKKVSSSRSIYSAAYIGGVLIALSQDGNNYYRGYCKVNAGETSFTYSLLPPNITFQKLYHVGHAVISNVSVDGNYQMGYTRDGINWNITSSPGTSGVYEYIDGKTVKKLNGSDYVTSDTSYTSANWTELQYDVNTTDTIGYFTPYMRSGVSPWWCYGRVYSTATGNQIPSINISSDQGQTWNTSFLTGITFPQTDQPKFFTMSDKVLAFYYGPGNIGKAFISSNGIDFAEIPFSSSMEQLNSGAYFPE